MKTVIHGSPEEVLGARDHGVFNGPEPTLEDLQDQQLKLQNRITERKRTEQAAAQQQEQKRRTAQAQAAVLLFDDVADEMAKRWQDFRKLHLELCELMNALADGAGSLSQLYNQIVQWRGLPDADLLAQVQRLAVCPNVLRDLLDEYESPTGTGYDWAVQVVPLKRVRGRK